MSVYTKSGKTSISNLDTVEIDSDDAFKVGIKAGAENIIIDYLTNLYADAPTAVCRELFTNAADASSDDLPVYIEIKKNDNEDGKRATYSFRITDYGCGMSSEELKNNYITYANSSKVEDYDTIGSFGLGSKSPMAIVPRYTVTSNNGSEQNVATVARTKNGIFAKIDKSDNVEEHSFTSVFFDGIENYVANRMSDYIHKYIIPFSKQPVHIQSCFENKNVETLDCIELDNDVTLYTNAMKPAMIKMSRINKNSDAFDILVRINNIVYVVSSVSPSCGYIVVDVEPGYFAFAPSRESIPSGEKRNHIIDIANEFSFNKFSSNGNDCDGFTRFVTSNNIMSNEEAFKISVVYDYSDCVDISSYLGDDTDYTDVIESADAAIANSDVYDKFDALVKSNDVDVYSIVAEYSSYGNKTKCGPLEHNTNIYGIINDNKHHLKIRGRINDDGNYDIAPSDLNGELLTTTKIHIITNSKFSKKYGTAVVPAIYKHSVLSNNMKTCISDNRTHSSGSRYSMNCYDSETFIYLKGNEDTIPSKIIAYANLFNFEYKDRKYNHVDISVEDYNDIVDKVVPSGTSRKRRELSQISDYVTIYSDGDYNSMSISYDTDKFVDAVKGVKYFIYGDQRHDNNFIRMFSQVMKCGVIDINNKTVMVKKYIESLGIKYLDDTDGNLPYIKVKARHYYADGALVENAINVSGSGNYYLEEISDTLRRSGNKLSEYRQTMLRALTKYNIFGINGISNYIVNPTKKPVCEFLLDIDYRVRRCVAESFGTDDKINGDAAKFIKKSVDMNRLVADFHSELFNNYICNHYHNIIFNFSGVPGFFVNTNKTAVPGIVYRIVSLDDIADESVKDKIDKADKIISNYSPSAKYIFVLDKLDTSDSVDKAVYDKVVDSAKKISEAINGIVR